MLYKYLFSILCGHLNLNQKRKKLNLTGYQANRPVYRPNRPVYRSNRSVPKCAGQFEFALGFDRFLPVTGQTGLVNRNRRTAVTANQSYILTLLVIRGALPLTVLVVCSFSFTFILDESLKKLY